MPFMLIVPTDKFEFDLGARLVSAGSIMVQSAFNYTLISTQISKDNERSLEIKGKFSID